MNTGLTDSQLTLLRTIKGKGVSHRTVTALHSDLEDSSFPYFVDIVPYDTISNPALKEHIDRVGKEI